MGVTEAVLALLEVGPRHGYGLKLAFEEATGGAWELNVGQVYSALQRLERDGLVALDGEEDGRKRYELTAGGRERLEQWLLRDPVGHAPTERDELSMKVLLARATAAADVRAVLGAQRDATMQALQGLTRDKAATGADGALEHLVHLDRRILHCRAELDWIDLVEQRLDDREPDNPHPDGRPPPDGSAIERTTTDQRPDAAPMTAERSDGVRTMGEDR
jgi:DNA-binding PadR family transcriptional regulator